MYFDPTLARAFSVLGCFISRIKPIRISSSVIYISCSLLLWRIFFFNPNSRNRGVDADHRFKKVRKFDKTR
jgi:hypothetical protein